MPAPKSDEQRMLELVEELHHVTGRLGLPPQSLRIDTRELNGQAPSVTGPLDTIERVDQFLGDLDAQAIADAARLDTVSAPANPDAFLLTGFIRPGTTVMLTGPPGSSKSWATRQLAIAAGAGLDMFLGQYEITRRLRCLVVDEDNGPDEEWRREETLLNHLELGRDRLDTIWRLSLGGMMLDQERWQAWLRGMIRLHDLDLLVLDPISEMHGGKELREDPSFRAMLAFLKRLKIDFPKLATVLVHHTRKISATERGTTRGIDDVRGQWGQTPDVVGLMWPLPERRVVWELHKRVPHSKLLLEAMAEGPLQKIEDQTASRSKLAISDDRVLACIDMGLGMKKDIVAHLSDPKRKDRIGKSAAYDAINRLIGAGILTKRQPYERISDPTDDPLEETIA